MKTCPRNRVGPVGRDLLEPQRLVHRRRASHRRQRIKADRSIPDRARFIEKPPDEQAAESRAAAGWPHVEALHLADVAADRLEGDASAREPVAPREEEPARTEAHTTRAAPRPRARSPGSRGRRRARPGTREGACGLRQSPRQAGIDDLDHGRRRPALLTRGCALLRFASSAMALPSGVENGK